MLLTDAAANGYADYVTGAASGSTAGHVGQAVVTVLAVALLTAASDLWPWLRPMPMPRQPIGYRD